MLLKVASLALVTLALAACGGAKQQPASTSPFPPGCTYPEVEQIVRNFLALPTLAPPGTFEVYATYESDGRKFLARTPARALAHIRRRQQLGEQSRLIELRLAPQDFNHVRIAFQLTRHATDFVRRGIHQRLVRGGGTIDCAHQRVAAWVTKGP